ncbi:MAG: selenide, water dikinase SelD, partial [Spirochaetales bacterium]|nr:selenide, water dikinase SelD [Spirochaetales bacterium]
VDSMTRLNKAARDTARRYTVHAATDVTGFSLAGHSQECAAASNVTIEFDINALPVIDGARELATFGFIPEGRYTNEDYLFDKVRFEAGIPQDLIDIAFDPQTSGGLLLFMPEEDARAFVREMDKPYCRIIGRVIPKTDRDVIFK